MTLFSACVFKILPLYLSILIGFIAGRKLDLSRETVAKIMLYILNPIVIFNGISRIQIDGGIIMLPFLIAAISCTMCILFYWLSGYIWSDATRSLVGFTAGNGNTGYFGLPIALLLFDDQGEGVYIMSIIGVTLFENTLGFYIFMRDTMTTKECVFKLLKLPTLYAFTLGILFNIFQIPTNEIMQEYMISAKGAYTIFGMMIIGLGLAGLHHLKLDYKFIGITFLARFVAWPVIMLFIISLDKHFFHLFDQVIYNALILTAIVPLGSNSVMMASLMKIHPEKAATAVVLSILLALFFVPFMAEQFMVVCP